jgi:hypothetical protein
MNHSSKSLIAAKVGLCLLTTTLSVLSQSVEARWHGRGGGHFGGHVRGSLYIAPLALPLYYASAYYPPVYYGYPPAYYPPTYYPQASYPAAIYSAPVYIQPNSAAPVYAPSGGQTAYSAAPPRSVGPPVPPAGSAPLPADGSGAPAQVGQWYFCAEAKAYFPYVNTCPSPWLAIPAPPQLPVR